MVLLCFAGCVQTVAIIGPIFGFLLGSLCAKLYDSFILVTIIFNGDSVQNIKLSFYKMIGW